MTDDTRSNAPQGSAYGYRRGHTNETLAAVGPGTPCGELLRRYWHPVALSARVQDVPRKVRILGEDLILFRDRNGRPGLLYPRCMHRGANLFYGRVEQDGLRCCYHGWKFDTEGRCLDQPCEPDHGRNRDAVRQPWYPLEERYGLVFAYMGPPDRKPVLPSYDNLESLGPNEVLWRRFGGFGATGDESLEIVPYSWTHMNDNVLDPFHVQVLHSTFSTVQFAPQFAVMPRVDFFETENGACYSAIRRLDDGREVERVSSWLMPNVMSVPDVTLKAGPSTGISWLVPVDDSHYIQAMVSRVPRTAGFRHMLYNGKTWGQMSADEHQRIPGDFEAQSSQGPVTLHSEEHLVSSDRGVMLQRRMLLQQMEVVAGGGDPLGVSFDPAAGPIKVRSGNFYRPARAAV